MSENPMKELPPSMDCDAFEKISHPAHPFRGLQLPAARVKLAQVGARAKTFFQSAIENQDASFGAGRIESGGKLLQVRKRSGTDFIEGPAMQRDFDHAVAQLPRNCVALEFLHAAGVALYISSICA